MKKLYILLIALILSIQTTFANTTTLVDFSGASIEEIQNYVDEGLLDYETIVRVYLDRIDHYNESYASIIRINENALKEARALDKEFKKKGRRSQLHGIPFLVKDNIDVKDMPTTAGAKGLENNVALKDAEIVKNLKDMGAIVLAKANMDEFAFNASKSQSSYGLVANAYDFNKTSYGSSGGTASGVASDLAVIGIGTDTGTSIRGTSSANNLYGLRPTKGSLSDLGTITFESSRDTSGPMGKYALDVALMYQGMKEGNDAFIKQDTKGMRVGIIRSKHNEAPSFIRNLIEDKIEDMKTLGIEVIDVPNLFVPYAFNNDNMCYEFNQYIKGTEGPIQSLADLARTGEYISYIDAYVNYHCDFDNTNTKEYKAYLNKQASKTNTAHQYFDRHNIDALLYPTLLEKVQNKSEFIYNDIKSYSYYIPPQTGFPGMNIPAGFHEGLPYGLELVARENDDDILLSIAIDLDELNSTYVLPDISPSLIELFELKDDLLAILDTKHTEEVYIQIQDSIKHFLSHFGTFDDPTQTATTLIDLYSSVEKDIQKEIETQKLLQKEKNKILLYLGIEGVLFSVLVILRLKRKKKMKETA